MNTHSPLSNNNNDFKVLCTNFNQDQGCFAFSHEQGFLVYNTNPIDLRVKRTFPQFSNTGTGIGHVTMLHRTNYLALVGGGKRPKFPNNKLVIWDDLKRKSSLNLEFMSPVLNVLLSRIRIVVVLKNQVVVYGFSSPPKKFATYETCDNEFGLADLSVSSSSSSGGISTGNSSSSSSSSSLSNLNSSVSSLGSYNSKEGSRYQTLAFPGRQIGQLQIVDVSPSGQEKNLISIVKAHKSKIRCLALNRSGSMVASASETGTIIRIHSTQNTALLYEFRRGLDRAIITSMRFSPDETRLAVLSDKNTLHVFNLLQIPSSSHDTSSSASSHGDFISSNDQGMQINRKHILNKLPVPIPFNNYFKSVWSFCSVNTNQYLSEVEKKHLDDEGSIGWSGNDTVIIVWKLKKTWEKYVILEKPGKYNNGISEWDLIRTSWKSLDNPLE